MICSRIGGLINVQGLNHLKMNLVWGVSWRVRWVVTPGGDRKC